MSLTLAELQRFVADLVVAPHRWRDLVRHTSDARVYERIWDDDQVNAWVICWSEDHDTGYHDHDASTAAIAGVSACIRKERLRIGAPPHSRTLRATFSKPAAYVVSRDRRRQMQTVASRAVVLAGPRRRAPGPAGGRC